MGTLRRTVQKEVYDALDRSVFTAEDFEVSFGDPDIEQWLVHISFAHDSEFSFCISEQLPGAGHNVVRSPGEIQQQEISYCTFGKALELIPLWAKEIRNELRASKPVYKELDALRELINEQMKESLSESDEFTIEEINTLRKKFNELEERVEKLEAENIITAKQLDEFKTGLKEVDDDIDTFPKQTWLKTATNKLVKVVAAIGKSQEGRKVLADSARKLLGLDQ